MHDVMLDIETLGTHPGSVVLSIGAVAFGVDEGLGASLYTVISVESSMNYGLTIDAPTLRWWAKQDRTTYVEALGAGPQPTTLGSALLDFSNWLEVHTHAERKMWGNGADFDLVLLLACYRKAGIEVPWKFWDHRCYRTLKALRPDIRAERTNGHNALDDARNQAEHAVALLRALR